MKHILPFILILTLAFGLAFACNPKSDQNDTEDIKNAKDNATESAKEENNADANADANANANNQQPPNQDPNRRPDPNEGVELVKSLPEFDAEEHDFGEIIEGQELEHTFVVTNKGTEDMLISNVKPTCGCTAREYTRDPIPPGGSGEIKTTVRTTRMHGEKTKTVQVYTNSEDKERIVLKLKFNALQIIEREPQQLNFQQVLEEEVRRKTLTLKVNQDLADDFEIIEVTELVQPNMLKEVDRVRDGNEVTLTFELDNQKVLEKIVTDAMRGVPQNEEGAEPEIPNIPESTPFRSRLEFKLKLKGAKKEEVKEDQSFQIYVTGHFQFAGDPKEAAKKVLENKE